MKIKKLMALLLICCSLSGCWDKVEIDRKSFISTIAIDAGQDIGMEEELKSIKPDERMKEENLKRLIITYGFPDISELGPEKSGTAKEDFVTVDAYSMQDGFSEMATRTSRDINFGHTKLLILSEGLMEYPETFKEILDYLERESSINKKMQVIIAKGKAEDYVKYEPIMEKNIESYIVGLVENSKRNSTIIPITLNKLLILLYQNGNAIVPNIYYDKAKEEINLWGVAVIKNYKLEGYLDKIETSGLQMLRGEVEGGKQSIVLDGHPVDYEIDGAKRKIALSYDDENKLKVKIDIELEGLLKDYTIDEEVFVKNKIKQIENNFNHSIEEQCETIARVTQKKFAVDPIGIKEDVEKFHPKIYKKVKDNWEETYKNADIDVVVKTRIRRIGVTR